MLLITETFVNETKGYILGTSDPYEPFTDNIRRLFLFLQKEYGKYVSRQYIDPDAKPIGWVFQKRMRYEDARTNRADDYYVQEVWVTLLNAPDTVTRTEHYHYL